MGFRKLNKQNKEFIAEKRKEGLSHKEVTNAFEDRFGFSISVPTSVKYQDFTKDKPEPDDEPEPDEEGVTSEPYNEVKEEIEEEVDEENNQEAEEVQEIKIKGKDTRTQTPEDSNSKDKEKNIVDLRKHEFEEPQKEAKRQTALDKGLVYLNTKTGKVSKSK